MQDLEAYSETWRDLFRELKKFGFSAEDLSFSLSWKGAPKKSPIILHLSQKLYILLGKVSCTSKELHAIFEEIEKKPLPHSKSELEVPDVLILTDVHWLIYNVLQHLRSGNIRPAKSGSKRDGKKICQDIQRIKDEAIRILPVQLIKLLDDPHYHKKDEKYFLWVDLGKGKKRIAGKTPEEVIRELKKHLKEVQKD